MTKDACLSVMEPIKAMLVGLVLDAWTKTNDGTEFPPSGRPVTRASLMNDWMWEYAYNRILQVGGFHEKTQDNQRFIMANDVPMAIRFKKMDNALKSSNIMTKSQRRYRKKNLPIPAQGQMLLLEDNADTEAYVEVGYILDKAGIEIDRIVVVDGGRMWQEELWNARAMAEADVPDVEDVSPADEAEELKPAEAPLKRDLRKARAGASSIESTTSEINPSGE